MERIKGIDRSNAHANAPEWRFEHQRCAWVFQLLRNNHIQGIFLNGSTSEGYHLTTEERKIMAEAWNEAAKGTDFKIFVFAGHLTPGRHAPLPNTQPNCHKCMASR